MTRNSPLPPGGRRSDSSTNRLPERGTVIALENGTIMTDSPRAVIAVNPLATSYLGLRLEHPFMGGASPLSAHLDGVRRLEDAGSAAIVLHSLFEEQISDEETGRIHGVDPVDDRDDAPLVDMFPAAGQYPFEPHEYLEHLRRVKDAVAVPVIASLNGTANGEWLKYAVLLEQAGADALEVNLYRVVSGFTVNAETVEGGIVQVVRDLKGVLRIPVALKLSPFFTAFANMAARLDHAGVDGLVLFNRFYQPDIDPSSLQAISTLELSSRSELRLRLRWLAILHGRLGASLAVTGGIESGMDGVKAILAGADAIQVVSALLRHGPGYLKRLVGDLREWMDSHEFAEIGHMRGRVSLKTSVDPANFERASYIHQLHRRMP
jgi:dihydroorotate dehydrogenase (fumarate)